MAGFFEIAISLFAASTVIIFVYALLCLFHVGVSLTVIFKGRQEFSRGHMRKFINGLSITLAMSFLYAVWNILKRMGLISIENAVIETLVDNIILLLFIMLLTYVAYLARELSRKFGFKSIGKKVSEVAKRSKHERKKK